MDTDGLLPRENEENEWDGVLNTNTDHHLPYENVEGIQNAEELANVIDTNGNNSSKPRRLIVIEPLLILYTISGYPSYSLHEQYFYIAVGKSMGIDVSNLNSTGNHSCGTEPNDTAYQEKQRVQAAAAHLSMYMELALFLPSICMMLIYGAYSDKLGRKLLFILPPIGSIIDAIIHMAIIYFELSVYVFFTSFIGGIIFGGYSLLYIGCYSYIADTIPPEKRALRMTIIDVILRFLGGFVSMGIGYWIRASGYLWPYLFVIGGNFLTLLYAIFLIPETVRRTPSSKFKFKDIMKSFNLFIKDDGSKRRLKIQVLTLSYVVEVIFMAMGIFTLFEMNAPLCWNSVLIGYYSAASDTIRAIGGILGGLLRHWFADHWIAVLAKTSTALDMVYLSMVQTTTMMFFSPLIGIFGILSSPMIRTMMSNLVNLDEQGALFSALHCLMSLVGLFSGTMSKTLYAATLYWWEGFCFFLSSIGMMLSVFSVLLYIYIVRREKQRYREVTVSS